MVNRIYTLTKEEYNQAMRYVGDLAWPGGESVTFGDFGNRLKISGLVCQGEEFTILLPFPGTEIETWVNDLGNLCFYNTVYAELSLDDWCLIIEQANNPVFLESTPSPLVKIVHRMLCSQVSSSVQWFIWARDGFKCMYCGQKANGKHALTVDHFVPLEKHGGNNSTNYLSACTTCDKEKGSQDPEKFCKKHGYSYKELELYLQGVVTNDTE